MKCELCGIEDEEVELLQAPIGAVHTDILECVNNLRLRISELKFVLRDIATALDNGQVQMAKEWTEKARV